MSDSVFLGGNPPFQPTANVTGGSVDNPGGTSTNLLPLTVTTQSKAFKNPESWNWNFTVEREFYANSVLSVAYVGRRGLHAQREADINQPTIATVLANPGVNLDALRPYKGYNSIRETDNVASSMYNSLQISWNKRFSKGLGAGVAYTLSKSMDDGSAQRDIIPNTYYAGNLWGQSDFDARHVLIINYIYELPFFKAQNNLASKALGGWQISGITQCQTGTPSSVAVSTDYAGVGQDGSMSGGGQFWVMNGTPSIVGQISPPTAPATTSTGSLPPIPAATRSGPSRPRAPSTASRPASATPSTTPVSRTGTSASSRPSSSLRRPAFSSAPRPSTSSTIRIWAARASTRPVPRSAKSPARTGDVRNMQLSLRLYF